MTPTTARLPRLAGALLAGTLLLAGCSGNAQTTTDGSPGSSPSTGQNADHNAADLSFATGMVPHHQSAITMARLAPGRAADQRILDLAARIQAAQAPEIDTLSAWLTEWGADDLGGMDHSGTGHGTGDDTSGMSEQDMTALTNASGAEFDRLFLAQMIPHHSSAVDMAVTEAADGQNTDAIAMAESIRDSQTQEIAEMQTLLTELGG
jgi:uncharacterized protein (DUF305 family)